MSDAPHPWEETGGLIAVTVPHMDDEAIGCGLHLATLKEPARAFFFFCGDGLGSFSQAFIDAKSAAALKSMRKAEAAAALSALGCAPDQSTFLDLTEWEYRAQQDRLTRALHAWLDELNPAIVCTPFRLDAHPDHLALGDAARAWATANPHVVLHEYFVYNHLKLLPGGDIRGLIQSGCLISRVPDANADRKAAALRAYVSQTTLCDPTWARPVLNEAFIWSAASDRECLLDTRQLASHPGWLRHATYVGLVHVAEPKMKRFKERVRKWLRSLAKKDANPI